MKRKGGEVPDGLNPGDGPPSFQECRRRNPWHNSDHYMVLDFLPSAPLTEHKRYLGRKKRWPVKPPGEPTRTDQLFAALRRAVSKAQPREARRNAWISETTWGLVDKRVSVRRDPRYRQAFTQRIGKEVKKSLAEDKKRRAD